MKTIVTTLALLMISGAASALEAPQSFAAAGCDVTALRPVLSADGATVLYWQNTGGEGCDAQKRGGTREDRERAAEKLVAKK